MKYFNTFKGLLLTLLPICTSTVFAHDFKVSGVFYNIIDDVNKTVEVTYSGTYPSEFSNEYTGKVVIPEYVVYNGDKYNIISIGDGAFQYCTSLTSVVLSNSVTNIGTNAFWGCSELANITIPNSVVNIGDCAFLDCSGLAEFVIPNNIRIIRYKVFEGCSRLVSINIPNSVRSIDMSAFHGCSRLTSVEIPNSVTSIGGDAFGYCSSLKSITLPNNISSIESNTFSYSGLTSVEIPDNVVSIGMNAFYGCSELEYITIGRYCRYVDYYAFYNCKKLTDVYFSKNISINSAFQSPTKLHLVLNDNNTIDLSKRNTYSDVSYTRTIAEGKYGTIILPFAPDAASLENYAFYELTESSDDYMKFEEVLTPIANTPYIYTLREGKENIAITGGQTTISSSIVTPEVDGWQTIGSFNNQTIDTSNGNYYALSANDNEINRITKNLTVLPYRAYFKSVDASKSALNIYISGTTGVEEILSSEIDGFENGAIFDLCGRKVVEPTNGNIYIKNGKKIMF